MGVALALVVVAVWVGVVFILIDLDAIKKKLDKRG